MTISSEERSTQPFSGNGVATSFPFEFKVFAKGDIVVVKTDAGGGDTTLVLDSDYSVALNADQDNNPGGTITYPISGAPLATGEKLIAYGDITYLQPADIVNQSGFYPLVIENALDRVTMLIQQVLGLARRAIRVPASAANVNTELPDIAQRADRVIAFDSSGNVTVSNMTLLEIESNASIRQGSRTTQVFSSISEGQTAIAGLYTFVPGANQIAVSLNGALQTPPRNGVAIDYAETDANTITFVSPLHAGDVVVVEFYGQTSNFADALNIGYRGRSVYDRLSDRVQGADHGATANGVADDTVALQAAVDRVAQSNREVDLGGKAFYSALGIYNPYGVRFANGKLLTPALIPGAKTQFNTYADDVNGLMVARENLYAFRLAVAAATAQTIYLYGDSTVETSAGFPAKPQDLVRFACWSRGISIGTVVNRGLSGTSWSDLNATPDLGASTKLIVIKYGINDAVKPNALATIASDARAKLAAIRANANGGVDNLSILLMGPNSTYRPSVGQDAKWYEDLRNLYLQLCKEFDCAYFDTYAYLQQTRNAPGQWMDDIAGSGEGLHPSPTAVYWIWWEAFGRYVLEDGYWNAAKTNHFWNITLGTGSVTPSTNPQDFPLGKSLWAGLSANGWPADGAIEVTKHADGTVEQRIWGLQVVPLTVSRRGIGTTWTQWTNVPNAMTPLLNSWANKAVGYNTAGWVVHEDGWVELYGTVTGGVLGTPLFVLPANARPGAAHTFATSGAAAGSYAVANIVIFSDGNVTPYAAANTTISLDGIRFRYGA